MIREPLITEIFVNTVNSLSSRHVRRATLALMVASLAACAKETAGGSAPASPGAANAAAQAIASDSLLQHIRDLSDDSTEGRAPGTPGEQKTIAYMQNQFKALGLKPGNPDGTYLQNVDLVGYKAHPAASFTARGKTIGLKYPDDYIANSRHNRPETKVTASDVVFVGYGVVAPEYGWDDYKGVDVKGKTILMLINDPPVRVANDSALDSTVFKGRAMTYYGRWTYKYEIATEKGAAAAIIIHETGPAGYPYSVVSTSNSQEQFDVPSPDAEKRVGVEGWITLDKAKELLSAAGQNFDSLKAAAVRKDFKPVALNAKANFDVKIDARQIQSHNVVAKIDGGDKKDEYVVYTAHWDHLGKDTTLKGDQIFNGAIDNASGSSAILEIAKAFSKLPTPPRRSVLFLSVTAEVSGLNRFSDIAPGLLLDRIGDARCAGLPDAELVFVRVIRDQPLEFVELPLREVVGTVKSLLDLLRHVVANVLAAGLLEGCGHTFGEGYTRRDGGVVSDIEDLALDGKLCHFCSPLMGSVIGHS